MSTLFSLIVAPFVAPQPRNARQIFIFVAMALLTKKEFKERCGLTAAMFRTYKGRNKFAMTGEHIDDQISPNRNFIEYRLNFLAKKAAKANKKSPVVNAKGAPVAENITEESGLAREKANDKEAPKFANLASFELDEQKKMVEIERIKSTTRLNELRIQKQEGELIPSELVKPLFAQIAKSLSAAFKHAADNLIVEIGHKKKLSLDEISDLRGRLTFEINDSIAKGVTDAKRQAKRISDDLSTTK